MDINKRELDRHITGNYGEDQFRDNEDVDYAPVLDSITKERIDAVSEAWNALIYEAGKDEIKRHKRGDSYYKNPIVSALSEKGDLVPLADALQKLFELRW